MKINKIFTRLVPILVHVLPKRHFFNNQTNPHQQKEVSTQKTSLTLVPNEHTRKRPA